MDSPLADIQADIGEPIVFRTSDCAVHKSTFESGSIWLRSGQYYREIEDQVRCDGMEGGNSGKTHVPLRFLVENGIRIQVEGPGEVSQIILPHYLMSLHGTSIALAQRHRFGGYTFGIRSLSKLAVEVLFQASRQLRCLGYSYGQVSYQYAALARLCGTSGAAIELAENPPQVLSVLNTHVLRKRPIAPFIDQDEWRIVIFTDGYLDNDPTLPLKINVSPSHFYSYLQPDRA